MTAFIGRKQELDTLSQALEGARQGTGSCFILAGEAGIGKSRLVEELKLRASSENFKIIQGNCREPNQSLPYGPWQSIVERAVPGSVEQAVKDFDTFIREQGPIQEWQFGPAQARAIWQPVLSVVGVSTSPFMKAGRSLLHDWLPQTEDCDIESTHLLQMQDPIAVANGLAAFFSRHPIR